MKKLCIFGASGVAKDAFLILVASGLKDEFECFFETDEIWEERKLLRYDVRPLSSFNPQVYKLVIAIGDSSARKKIAELVPPGTEFFSMIHPSVKLSQWVEIGEGSIIGEGCIFTIDIKIGKHAYINIGTTISHDCRIGDYFTASPAVNISGNCTIGDCVFMGINSSVREKITIEDNIVVGMGSAVINDLIEPGTYVGVPAKLLIR
jgi:sugar O-acyltransferase (sialic acid O-acetyltransferase NeuD family)